MSTTRPIAADGPANAADAFLGVGPLAERLYETAYRAATRQCPLLITGETGVGKEIWAKQTHRLGPRRRGPFIPVNCAALTASLAESQLFGHERGAFTGATGSALGVFRAAQNGVVFLDEIGDMPLDLQPKLLRVLQEQEVTPLGASAPVPIDVQVIAATNRDLAQEVAEGRFREDLYFRLNLLELRLPPLRYRLDELPAFVAWFSQRYAARYKQPLWRPDGATLDRFRRYDWPGNFRQLAHVIEQAYVLDCAPHVPTSEPPCDAASGPLPFLNLARLREEAVRQALERTGGHKGMAADLLGIHPNTMTRLLRKMPHVAQQSGCGSRRPQAS